MLNLTDRKEVFWDDVLTDAAGTTAPLRLHEPVLREKVFTFDAPWEGNACIYFSTVFIPELKRWRMYYLAMHMKISVSDTRSSRVSVCCIESADGLTWYRPSLGIKKFDGNPDNNILLNMDDLPGIREIDNFFVMYDENPSPAVPERFKATMQYTGDWLPDGHRDRRLVSLVSEDGLHFRLFSDISSYGTFDSCNTVHWNPVLKKYVCFFRSMHDGETQADFDKDRPWNEQVRDIRVTYSEDFIRWTVPERVAYSDGYDFPMYTNCVSPCPGAPHLMIGLPTRYTERKAWTPNLDRLCGAGPRRERMALEPRFGLALTDCLFMFSRDGLHFTRFPEAFLRPGPEFPQNWVYGSCYPATGFIPTPGMFPGSENEWSIYTKQNHWMDAPAELYRYALRQDGFVSRHAGTKEETVLTKPFVFSGRELQINFATSARGYLMLKLAGKDRVLHSGELFGDSVCRTVDFDGDLSALAGKPVTLEITLSDADLYSLRFSGDQRQ